MREIKFRCWFENIKKPGSNEHMIYSDKDCNGNMVRFYQSVYGWSDKAGRHLMQFIGLKDANGKDIYEGDIVKGYEEGYNDFVVYEENKFILKPQGDDCVFWEKCVVIGNIYSNPELKITLEEIEF